MVAPVQADVLEGEIVMLGVAPDVIAIVKGFDVAVTVDAHVAFEVKTQLTICPFVNVEELNVVEFVPTLTASTNHW